MPIARTRATGSELSGKVESPCPPLSFEIGSEVQIIAMSKQFSPIEEWRDCLSRLQAIPNPTEFQVGEMANLAEAIALVEE